MNQPKNGESSRKKQLPALLALSILASAGMCADAIMPIDLTPYYDKSPSWDSGNEWVKAPRGSTVVSGVPFEVNGLLRLSSQNTRNENKQYRDELREIPVGKKFERLHVLHIVSYSGSDGQPYARIALHYADGSTALLPLVYGRHARNFHRPKYESRSAVSDPNSKVVWRGEYDATTATGETLRIFKSTFANPKPGQEVATIDLSSADSTPSATILALSIGPADLPAPGVDAPGLPEPEEVLEGQLKFTAVDAVSGQPVANVRLRITGTHAGGSFRAPNATTDARGECLVRHPGDSTTSLMIYTLGDGVPEQSIGWQVKRAGEPIPSEHTFRVTKAVTIGGVVQDESGQPVSGATMAIEQFEIYYFEKIPVSTSPQVALGLTTPRTDSQGRWEFRSLPEGFRDFVMTVSHPDLATTRIYNDGMRYTYSPTAGERLTLRSLLATNAVLKVHKGFAISGRALTEKGEPIIAARVLLREGRWVKKPNETMTDERGEFRLAGAMPGRASVTVQAAGYSPESRTVFLEAKTEPAEFRLAPGHLFKARVLDEYGSPVRGVLVTVDLWQGQATLDIKGYTDSSGRVTIGSMPDSDLSGSIFKSGYMDTGGIKFVADGEEHDLILRRIATIAGRVVDAETKQPVNRFDVTAGTRNGDGSIYWDEQNPTNGADGAFTFIMKRPGTIALKVESDSYLPATITLGTNGETYFDIELRKGSGASGIVHTPDGQPAAGAQIGVLALTGPMIMGARGFDNVSSDPRRTTQTDAQGVFSVRAFPDGEKIVIVHPTGYAEVPFTNIVRGGTIQLQPWGIVEGTLNLGQRPGSNLFVLLTPGSRLATRSFFSYRTEDYKVATDAAGRFVISNVPPGQRRVMRYLGSAEGQPRADVVVKPGEVTRVTLGGDGRLVIGQLTASDPTLLIDWANSGPHQLNSYAKPPAFKTSEETRAWWFTPEGIQARKKSRFYVVEMDASGAFRIEDVLSGAYDLSFRLRRPSRDGFAEFVASLSTNIVIPEFSKGSNVPPIDLGRMEIKVPSAQQSGFPTTPPDKTAAANKAP